MIRILSAVLLLMSANAFSAEVEKLYEASVLAKNDLSKEKQAAFKQVLIRVTGDPAPTKNSIINQSMLNVTDYIVQFRYIDSGGKHRFWAQFDPKQVKKLLRQAKLPEWGQHRPQALFWIAREDKLGREIVADDSKGVVNSVLHSQAKLRGLPIVLPLLDLNDTSLVSASDVWGKFTKPIVKASARYDTDVIVVANMYPISANQWLLNWDLMGKQAGGKYGSLAHGEIRHGEQAVVRNMVNKVTQSLAKIYAVNLGDKSQDMVSLKIKGLKRVEDYVEVNQLLAQISAISHRQVTKVIGDKVIWDLTMLGGEQDLMRALALDKRLEFYALEPATKQKPEKKNKLEGENKPEIKESKIEVLSLDLINKYPVVYYHWIKQ